MFRLDTEMRKFSTCDERVRRVLTGMMSVEQFLAFLRETDPYVLIGDTVYAMTEAEYAKSHASFASGQMSREAFESFVGSEDLSYMSEQDRDTILMIREQLPKCSSCRYKRFKDAAYKLAKRYGIPTGTAEAAAETYEYPKPDAPVEEKVSRLIEGFFRIPLEKRKACLDCTEKHLSQAFILAGETLAGYPEHLKLMCAHLGEALEEMPEDAGALRSTVQFFLSRSISTGKPFLPIGTASALLDILRMGHTEEPRQSTVQDSENPYLALDITDDIRKELSALPEDLRCLLRDRLSAADEHNGGNGTPESGEGLKWEGLMANASECIAQSAPLTANAIRARRLLFTADPFNAELCGYSNRDIIGCLDGDRG